MSRVCALAGDTKVETPEGPMAVRSVAGKLIPVFSRDPNGRVRFRPMRDVQSIASEAPLYRVVLDNGRSFRAGAGQRVFTLEMSPVAIAELAPGTVLLSAFHYPAGYRYLRTDGHEEVSLGGWKVVQVEPAGSGELFTLRVPPENCFFVTAGVLCQSEA